MKKSKLGLYCSAFGIMFWLFIVLGLVIKLPVKTPTLILLSWPILPGIICGYVFYKMDEKDCWR